MSGASNAQNTWFNSSQNRFAEKKANDAIQRLGKALPATVVSVSGSIVTVNFDVDATPFTLPRVTMPLAGSEYTRLPIQQGCRGVAFPADARLGSTSGLGSGTPNLVRPGNLSALVFFPIGNADWSPSDDPNALVLYGPNGVVARNTDGTGKVVVDATHAEMTFGGHSIVIDASGIKIDGVDFLTHFHTGVTSGSDDTGPVGP